MAQDPFHALEDEQVCLTCASPLNTNCGFSNWSLSCVGASPISSIDANKQLWNLELFSCDCAECEVHCGTSTHVKRDADALARLMERHRTQKLDSMLCVDSCVEKLREKACNEVPLINIRLALDSDKQLAAALPQDDNIFLLFHEDDSPHENEEWPSPIQTVGVEKAQGIGRGTPTVHSRLPV